MRAIIEDFQLAAQANHQHGAATTKHFTVDDTCQSMNPPAQTRPLSLPPETTVVEIPFDGDQLDRKQMAERLTAYLDRLRDGSVLAIDAPWGEGKSWFGRNWAAMLRNGNHKVAYIDAFEQDFIEDPFLLIAAEISSLVDAGEKEKWKARAAGVMKALLPVGTKALINVAGKALMGTSDLTGDFLDAAKAAQGKAADAAEEWVKKKIEDHEIEKQSLQHFRETLAAFAAAQTKPVVVFIDELDRCRPSFAVRLVERIKHFFDVPNLVFVLLMNRDQLEKAIRGVYGSDTDATAYLGKFIHLSWRLPRDHSLQASHPNHSALVFVKSVLERYGFDRNTQGSAQEFAPELAAWVVALQLSLRDVQRACALYVMANTSWTGLVAYLIALKINRPSLFAKIHAGSSATHQECQQWLSTLVDQSPDGDKSWPGTYFQALAELHGSLHGEANSTAGRPIANSHLLFGNRNNLPHGNPFVTCIQRIDLTVQTY
ncbi:P-loop NTPase fold protein [Paraburkholderia nemoris]|uniref:KAP family P-loop NTPase fold protein n=1 Tax=Paraburkholderia nemoris TaxID=2793076 RepID=UPI001B8C97C8|nr:P-loop NTPase fold protein [Paraburkholderia nemoris]